MDQGEGYQNIDQQRKPNIVAKISITVEYPSSIYKQLRRIPIISVFSHCLRITLLENMKTRSTCSNASSPAPKLHMMLAIAQSSSDHQAYLIAFSSREKTGLTGLILSLMVPPESPSECELGSLG